MDRKRVVRDNRCETLPSKRAMASKQHNIQGRPLQDLQQDHVGSCASKAVSPNGAIGERSGTEVKTERFKEKGTTVSTQPTPLQSPRTPRKRPRNIYYSELDAVGNQQVGDKDPRAHQWPAQVSSINTNQAATVTKDAPRGETGELYKVQLRGARYGLKVLVKDEDELLNFFTEPEQILKLRRVAVIQGAMVESVPRTEIIVKWYSSTNPRARVARGVLQKRRQDRSEKQTHQDENGREKEASQWIKRDWIPDSPHRLASFHEGYEFRRRHRGRVLKEVIKGLKFSDTNCYLVS